MLLCCNAFLCLFFFGNALGNAMSVLLLTDEDGGIEGYYDPAGTIWNALS